MKPTQKQIDAALRYEDGNEDGDDLMILDEVKYRSEEWEQVSFRIIAAAYRELREENLRIGWECVEERCIRGVLTITLSP